MYKSKGLSVKLYWLEVFARERMFTTKRYSGIHINMYTFFFFFFLNSTNLFVLDLSVRSHYRL